MKKFLAFTLLSALACGSDDVLDFDTINDGGADEPELGTAEQAMITTAANSVAAGTPKYISGVNMLNPGGGYAQCASNGPSSQDCYLPNIKTLQVGLVGVDPLLHGYLATVRSHVQSSLNSSTYTGTNWTVNLLADGTYDDNHSGGVTITDVCYDSPDPTLTWGVDDIRSYYNYFPTGALAPMTEGLPGTFRSHHDASQLIIDTCRILDRAGGVSSFFERIFKHAAAAGIYHAAAIGINSGPPTKGYATSSAVSTGSVKTSLPGYQSCLAKKLNVSGGTSLSVTNASQCPVPTF